MLYAHVPNHRYRLVLLWRICHRKTYEHEDLIILSYVHVKPLIDTSYLLICAVHSAAGQRGGEAREERGDYRCSGNRWRWWRGGRRQIRRDVRIEVCMYTHTVLPECILIFHSVLCLFTSMQLIIYNFRNWVCVQKNGNDSVKKDPISEICNLHWHQYKILHHILYNTLTFCIQSEWHNR